MNIPLEELRLGNLVSINNKIIEVDRKILYSILMGIEGYNPKAIPITEEILKMLGFYEKEIAVKYWFNDAPTKIKCLCYSFFAFAIKTNKDGIQRLFLGKIEEVESGNIQVFNESCLPPIYNGTGLHRLQNAISEYTSFVDLNLDLKNKLNINSDLIKGKTI